MMNLTCDIVMDLVSIYKDKLASQSTCEAIKEHLKECQNCRKYYKQYDSINQIELEPEKRNVDLRDDFMQKYTELSVKLNHRRKLIIAGMAVFACASVCSVLISTLKTNKKCNY